MTSQGAAGYQTGLLLVEAAQHCILPQCVLIVKLWFWDVPFDNNVNQTALRDLSKKMQLQVAMRPNLLTAPESLGDKLQGRKACLVMQLLPWLASFASSS